MVGAAGASQQPGSSFLNCVQSGGKVSFLSPDKGDGFRLVGVCVPRDRATVSGNGKSSGVGPLGKIWNAIVSTVREIGKALKQ